MCGEEIDSVVIFFAMMGGEVTPGTKKIHRDGERMLLHICVHKDKASLSLKSDLNN